jgi:putative redox protein
MVTRASAALSCSSARTVCHLPPQTASLVVGMEIRVQYDGGVRFTADARGHRVVCDQPISNAGTDTGMTPPEFLLASLGTCAGYYAAQYLKTRNLETQGLEIKVSAEKELKPARLATFRIEVTVPGLPPEHEAGMRRAVDACLIKNTLAQPPAIETVITTPVAALA